MTCKQYLCILRHLFIALVAMIIFGSTTGAVADSKRGIPGSESGNYAAQYEQIILRGVKLNDVFQINDIMTTPFGPAYANIWTETANFLACNPPQARQFSYALCYYSGPDEATGLSIDNPALPCVLSPDGKVANCKCYKLSTDIIPPQVPYFVDIHAILNRDIYDKTVEACGADGSGCASFTGITAPVCDAINTNQLIPGADLVSVFSPVKKLDYFAGATNCNQPGSIYAGCMTAPCYDYGEVDENNMPIVECSCPLFAGPFEIGQGPQQGGQLLDCDLGASNVWSAAHNPKTNNPIDPMPPEGRCTPDAPPEAGCPLYPDGNGGSFDPFGPVCQAVCKAYEASNEDGIQLGYTCDSTLCTTLGIGQDLPFAATMGERLDLMQQACSGIQSLDGLDLIAEVEALAGCSCCASQLCGCAEKGDINVETNDVISDLNQQQIAVGIVPQCNLNGTLCGSQ